MYARNIARDRQLEPTRPARMPMMAARGHLTLPFGAFYGLMDRRHRAPGLEIALLSVDPHRIVERHSHDEAHFVFVLDGLYLSSAAGAPPVSSGPTLIFNPAGTTHRDRFEARDRVVSGQFLTLSISNELMDAARYEAGALHRAVTLHAQTALATAGRLAAASAAAMPVATIDHESLALSLLAEVHAVRSTARLDAPAWLALACEHLDESLGTDVSIRDIAKTAGVHPVHLSRVFRRCLGLTPADYRRRRRLAHASALLRETRRPLSDIALACGFTDQPHFTTAFRREFGVTPRQYRTRGAKAPRLAPAPQHHE